MEFFVDNLDKTLYIGEQIGRLCNPGDIICLIGDLGTGKTHMTKGIAKGLNIEDYITSPTFNIVNEYTSGRIKLFHFDVYRVNDPDEIAAIGFDEYIFSDGVSIIEWANYIDELIPKEHISILIEKIPDHSECRKITINYYGDRYKYIKEIKL
ncbi:MAG: tRNA (adenosine(37)-N6)-threonylcarbamoyltransferase complex ATPase subunit type 1 TsaE [Clostridiaceae bacterium]